VAQATAEVIQDTTPENPDDYPDITYWCKRVQLDEKNRQLEFAKSSPGRKRKRKSKGKNVAFWHFQHRDGTVLDYEEVKSIRKDSKKIWRKLCNKYGPIGAPWTTISPDRQLEFYIKIEAKYPLLQLCENHYKAKSISFSNYSHWYDKRFPSGDEPAPAQVRKCSRTTKSHKGPRPAKKAWDLKKAQGSGNSSSEYSSPDDSSSEDESSDEEDCPVEGNNAQSVEDPEAEAEADTEDNPLPCQLPFTAPRTSPRRPTRTASSTSPPNAPPSSAPPASKQKQKPCPVGFNPNPL
jgi:hypothetical protein